MRIDVLLHSVADGLTDPATPSPSPRVRILIWSLVVFSSLLCRHHGHRSPQRRRQCQFNALREGAAVQCREQYPPPSVPASHEFSSLFLSSPLSSVLYDVITGPSVVVIERDSLNQALLEEPLLCPLLRATVPRRIVNHDRVRACPFPVHSAWTFAFQLQMRRRRRRLSPSASLPPTANLANE